MASLGSQVRSPGCLGDGPQSARTTTMPTIAGPLAPLPVLPRPRPLFLMPFITPVPLLPRTPCQFATKTGHPPLCDDADMYTFIRSFDGNSLLGMSYLVESLSQSLVLPGVTFRATPFPQHRLFNGCPPSRFFGSRTFFLCPPFSRWRLPPF